MKLCMGMLYGAVICFIFPFCSHSNADDEILPQANIQITTPAENSVIHLGETLLIRGSATCATELHGYEIGIRKTGQSNLYFQHYHGHGTTINIEENWHNNLNETADMELVVDVVLDHEEHKQSKIIPFKIQN